jgi:hypothetical protein
VERKERGRRLMEEGRRRLSVGFNGRHNNGMHPTR